MPLSFLMPACFFFVQKKLQCPDISFIAANRPKPKTGRFFPLNRKPANWNRLPRNSICHVAEMLTESKSAKEPGRPVFNAMMQRLYRGEAAGIICWKLDRLARNPVDGGSVIWAIKQHGIRVMTPAQSYAREDDNIILMYIEFGMAQKYVDDLSKNVKARPKNQD